MATEERLPPACAFAISVLAEHEQDPEAVPEEAVEAAQQHIALCARCTADFTPPATETRKRKKGRRVAEPEYNHRSDTQTLLDESNVRPTEQAIQQAVVPIAGQSTAVASATGEGAFDCLQCRPLLVEYAEALESGLNVAVLYPEAHAHLQTCDAGCPVLLELCRQEVKAASKKQRKLVRNPFKVIGWEIGGFFHGGQVPIAPRALAFGTLLLLLLFASASTFVGINLYEAHYHPTTSTATPDGIGISDGLKTYDACNTESFNDKRQAVQALQSGDLTKADSLLKAASNATLTDSAGCNGAEAAIYREDLRVRQAKHPFNIIVVGFDSGAGDPQSGADRKMLYVASTQELVGAYIAQQQYNVAQMKIAKAPLLYLILANTTGSKQGALQIANTVAAQAKNVQQPGLLAQGSHLLMGMLGAGSSDLTQTILPTLCRMGIPLIAPTATGPYVTDLLSQVGVYNSCAPGFAFVRSSADDKQQSDAGAAYAYHALKARNIAIFYDQSNQASRTMAQGFRDTFAEYKPTQIVAQEAVANGGLLDANGHSQASREDLLAGLNDALKAKTRPDMIFAALPTNDVTTLIQAIARLSKDQQPAVMVGGEFVQPRLLRGLVQWARQQQLTLPPIVAIQAATARPPTDDVWQKQFYASFCTSFATAGSSCSGAATLDQGALLFADGIRLIARGMSGSKNDSKLPSREDLVQKMSSDTFMGVSGSITLQAHSSVVTNTAAVPVIVSVQQDGSLQIVV